MRTNPQVYYKDNFKGKRKEKSITGLGGGLTPGETGRLTVGH